MLSFLKALLSHENCHLDHYLINDKNLTPLLMLATEHFQRSNIVGKGGHAPPPFSKIPPFLEIQDVPTFHRPIRKTKVLNNSCNQFVYNFYPQCILILEECLQKLQNANLICL